MARKTVRISAQDFAANVATVTRRLATLTQAAEHVGCSERTIRRWIAIGQITGYRVGEKLVRIDLNELDDQVTVIPAAGNL